jgi:hypothetical protein
LYKVHRRLYRGRSDFMIAISVKNNIHVHRPPISLHLHMNLTSTLNSL